MVVGGAGELGSLGGCEGWGDGAVAEGCGVEAVSSCTVLLSFCSNHRAVMGRLYVFLMAMSMTDP